MKVTSSQRPLLSLLSLKHLWFRFWTLLDFVSFFLLLNFLFIQQELSETFSQTLWHLHHPQVVSQLRRLLLKYRHPQLLKPHRLPKLPHLSTYRPSIRDSEHPRKFSVAPRKKVPLPHRSTPKVRSAMVSTRPLVN